MKKLISILLVFSYLFIGCNSSENIVENENLNKVDNIVEEKISSEEIKEEIEDNSYFIVINASLFKEKFYNNEKNIFFVGRDTCPACKNFKPTVMEFANKEKINIYYVNIGNFENNDFDMISDFVNIQYIPTLIISNNGKILYNESSVKSYDVLKNLVEEYMK